MLLLEDKIANVVNKLVIGDCFGGDSDCDYYGQVEDVKDQLGVWRGGRKDIFVTHGVSKMAIVLKDAAEVIKISFNGEWKATSEIWNDETEEWEMPDCDDEFISFEGSGSAEDCADYCLAEYELYQIICEHGYGKYFAAVRPYEKKCCGHRVFLQEKVKVHSDIEKSKPSEDSLKKADDWDRYGISHNKDWNAMFIDFYGADVAEELAHFVQEVMPEIGDDLHSSNIGYRMNGEPVILDYTGWNS